MNGEDEGVKSMSELMKFVDSTEEIAEEKSKREKGKHDRHFDLAPSLMMTGFPFQITSNVAPLVIILFRANR